MRSHREWVEQYLAMSKEERDRERRALTTRTHALREADNAVRRIDAGAAGRHHAATPSAQPRHVKAD